MTSWVIMSPLESVFVERSPPHNHTSISNKMKTNSIPLGDAHVRVSDYLHEHKESILSEWLEQVRDDPAISATDILNTVAVRNHLPEIINDLTASLRRIDSVTAANQACKDAEEHGAARMQQGYELSEMLREIKHLRAIIIRHLRLFDDQNREIELPVRVLISTTLHAFLDQLMIDATEEFLWAKMTLQERVHLGYIRS